MSEPVDQVPRLTKFRDEHPGVRIRLPGDRLLYDARGEFGGQRFHLRTATLEQLLDALDALAREAEDRAKAEGTS